jgi:hypothetical protein
MNQASKTGAARKNKQTKDERIEALQKALGRETARALMLGWMVQDGCPEKTVFAWKDGEATKLRLYRPLNSMGGFIAILSQNGYPEHVLPVDEARETYRRLASDSDTAYARELRDAVEELAQFRNKACEEALAQAKVIQGRCA